MKFQDKFASLQQLHSPNYQDKFQICCIDMYVIRFLASFAVPLQNEFPEFWEFQFIPRHANEQR